MEQFVKIIMTGGRHRGLQFESRAVRFDSGTLIQTPHLLSEGTALK